MSDGFDVMASPDRLIRASAGSGKTYQLSSRYLSLLRDGADADRILATTFTRKAAGEILARVLSRLVEDDGTLSSQLAVDFPPSPGSRLRTSRQMIEALTQQLHRLSISTLDSFFHRMATAFAMELALPAGVTLMDDEDQRIHELRLEAIEAVLAEAGEDDRSFEALLDLLKRLHHDQAKRSTTHAIVRIVTNLHVKYVEQPIETAWAQPDLPPAFLSEAEIESLTSRLVEAEIDAPRKADGQLYARCADAYSQAIRCLHRRAWSDLLEMTLLNKAFEDSPKYSSAPLPDSWITPFQKLLQHAAVVELQKLRNGNIARHELLRQFHRHFTALKRSRGIVTFSDVTTLLCQSLPDRADVYYRLDGRIEHLLLDEFQDTSPAQWRVLQPLASETASALDRSFFCVGDIKQAIYGWRGGCAQLFDTVIRDLHLSPESVQDLNTNWRSSQVILDAVNQVFGALNTWPVMQSDPILAETAATWTANFHRHEAAKPNANMSGYVCLLSSQHDLEDDTGNESDELEERDESSPVVVKPHDRYTAEVIAQLARDHPRRSVGVLVRKRKYAGILLDQLRLLNIEASGEGGAVISDDYMVNLILAAMQLADHPGNDIAMFQLINSPMADILGLLENTATEVAHGIRKWLMDQGYAVLVAAWIQALLPMGDERNRRRLRQLAQLAETYDSSLAGDASVRPRRFCRFVKSRRVEEASGAPVRVMTVHQSKGLEFDIVVLPELLGNKLGSLGRQDVYITRDDPTGPVTGVYPATNEDMRSRSGPLMAAYHQEQRRRLDDDLAVLYVAMSRAKRALWMIAPPVKLGNKNTLSSVGLTNSTYATLLRQALAGIHEPDFEQSRLTEPDSILFELGNPKWDAGSSALAHEKQAPTAIAFGLRKINMAAKRRDSGRELISPSGMEAAGWLTGRDLLSSGGRLARLCGSVIHSWFESVRWLDQSQRPDHKQMIEIAVVMGATREQAESWVSIFEQAVRQPELAALLSHRPGGEDDEIHNELALAWVEGSGRMVFGRADRVVVYGDGSGAQVIDFKTDQLGDPLDDAKLAEAVRRYQPQLALYVDAVARRFDLEWGSITAKLAMVMAGRVVTLEGVSS